MDAPLVDETRKARGGNGMERRASASVSANASGSSIIASIFGRPIKRAR